MKSFLGWFIKGGPYLNERFLCWLAQALFYLGLLLIIMVPIYAIGEIAVEVRRGWLSLEYNSGSEVLSRFVSVIWTTLAHLFTAFLVLLASQGVHWGLNVLSYLSVVAGEEEEEM